MIEQLGDDIEMVCDDGRVADCVGAFAVVDCDDFDVLLTDAKAARWRTYRRDGHFKHACPACTAVSWADQRGGRLL